MRIELDSRKKGKRVRMMRSKSFDTQKTAGVSRGFIILWIGIMEDVFPMEGKECKVQERLKMRRRRFMPEQGEIEGSRNKFSVGEGRAKGRVRFLRARGSAELRKVASGSATQGLWQGDRKVGSQVIGED